MVNIKLNWFKDEPQPKTIVCSHIDLIGNDKEGILCFLLSLNLYPQFQPALTHYSYILENNTTGYLIICGNNRDTTGFVRFKFTKQ